MQETLDAIKSGEMQVSDLPPIQVLVGENGNGNNFQKDDNSNENHNQGQEEWFFSLNNRRLWVLKRLREEGFLEANNNKVFVRVRAPKSKQERERYNVENCALEAKIVPENKKKGSKKKIKVEETGEKNANMLQEITISEASGNDTHDDCCPKEKTCEVAEEQSIETFVRWRDGQEISSDSEDSDDSDLVVPSNRFCALSL